jgi:hypothetical protein
LFSLARGVFDALLVNLAVLQSDVEHAHPMDIVEFEALDQSAIRKHRVG